MAFDTLVLSACLADIEKRALGAKINKIHQPDKYSLILRFYGRNGAGKILVSAAAESARLHLTETNPANPTKAPLFLMVARKWLEGATLTAIRQTPYERVAELEFSTRNDLGDQISLRLIAEIMGKHSNIILVDGTDTIIDGIRRYDSRLSRYREVLPQRPYLPPPPYNKAPPRFADEEALGAALQQGDWQQALEKALPGRVAGLSPWLTREVLLQSNLPATLSIEELELGQLSALLLALKNTLGRLENGDFAPTLLLEAGRPADFCAFAPLLWQGKDTRPHATMSEAVDALYELRARDQEFLRAQHLLEKSLRQHISRLQRKIALQQADLAMSERGEEFKDAGDLLAAHLYALGQQAGSSGRGLAEVSLPSFSDPDQSVRIELDAALTPQQNIQNYYRRYNKCRKARVAIEIHLNAAEEEHAYLQSIAQSLQAAKQVEELAEIERELRGAGILPAPPPVKGKKTPAETAQSLPPRSYISADGFTILIGRNNRQNDRLTLKQAAPEDIWLHTQKIPGSHVIIVTEARNVPDTTLTEAAAYAAWFSQAANSGKTPVDYTRVSQVKKPTGAKPGMVIYFQQQTVYVEPREPNE